MTRFSVALVAGWLIAAPAMAQNGPAAPTTDPLQTSPQGLPVTAVELDAAAELEAAVDPVLEALKAELARLEAEALVPHTTVAAGPSLKQGMSGERVAALRLRLDELEAAGVFVPTPAPQAGAQTVATVEATDEGIVTVEPPGDEVAAEVGAVTTVATYFDAGLEERVKAFQRSRGFVDDGVVGPRTLHALNFGSEEAILALRDTIGRYTPPPASGKSILVNVPAAEIVAFENGREVFRSRAVVGKFDTQTPIMTSNMVAIKYNPDWSVPPTLTRKYIDALRRGEVDSVRSHGVLAVAPDGGRVDVGMVSPEIFANEGWRFYQPPGDDNALGKLKFELDNTESIYLHDTNERYLFRRDNRARSNGCVRVEKFLEMASWVMEVDIPTIEAGIAVRRTHFDRLPHKVPVMMRYYLAYPDETGRIHYHPDVYRMIDARDS